MYSLHRAALGQVLWIASFSSTALGQQLWTESRSTNGTAPALTVFSRDAELLPGADSSKWAYRLLDSTRVFAVANIAFNGPADSGSAARGVRVRLYALSKSPTKVFMHVVPKADAPKLIKELRGAALSGSRVPLEEVFYTFHLARQMASSRVKAISSDEQRVFGVFDAIVFARLLEAANELGRYANLELSPDVQDVLRMAERQLGDPQGARVYVKAGVDTVLLRSSIRENRMLEVTQMTRVLRDIRSAYPSATPDACRWYARLLNAITEQVDRKWLDAAGSDQEADVVVEVATQVDGCERTAAVAELAKALSAARLVPRERRPDVSLKLGLAIKRIRIGR